MSLLFVLCFVAAFPVALPTYWLHPSLVVVVHAFRVEESDAPSGGARLRPALVRSKIVLGVPGFATGIADFMGDPPGEIVLVPLAFRRDVHKFKTFFA